ncbi:hypothetical protein Tco_1032070 [Tanacetum coccineum]|uniref:Uncharacterized protein n=1 Tax=Tanacetum coccineum TaxID=301880 RepID=A0ABQ5GCI1_9ASTR
MGNNCKIYKTSGSSSINTKSGEASIKLNVDVGDDEEDEGALGSSSMNDKALAILMVSEIAMHTNVPLKCRQKNRMPFKIKCDIMNVYHESMIIHGIRQPSKDNEDINPVKRDPSHCGIGFVLDFVEFISFTFGDKEMISVIEAVSR